MEEQFQSNAENQNTQFGGDKVDGDKYEAEKIEINEYFEKIEAKICPKCQEHFDENTIREGKKIKCGNCGTISYELNFEKYVAIQYPNVSSNQKEEFERLRGIVLKYIRLERFKEALEYSEKLIVMCPDAPHSFLYNALCTYLNQNKSELIYESADKTIKRLEIAKEEFDDDAEKDDLENVSSYIATHYFYLLQNAIYNLNEQYMKSKRLDKNSFYGYFFLHVRELFTCYRIFQNIDFLKLAVEHIYGYHGFAWYIFKPDDTKYSDLQSVIDEGEFKILPKYKKINNYVEQLKKKLKEINALDLIPEKKIDFSHVTGTESPETLASILLNINSTNNKVVEWENEVQLQLEKANKVSTDELVELIKKQNPKDYNYIRILRETEKRIPYYFVDYQSIIIDREERDYTVYLFPETKKKFLKTIAKAKFGIKNYKRIDEGFSFSKNEMKLEQSGIQGFQFLPILKTDKYISSQQPTFYDPENIEIYTCTECMGSKYLHCTHCDGKHRVSCTSCNRTGYRTCNKCNGRGALKCKKCGGSGTVTNNGKREVCSRSVLSVLGVENEGCDGAGVVQCQKCNSTGRTICKKCDGKTYTECSYCHGDINNKLTYGKVDCQSCNTAGEIASFKSIHSEIIKHNKKYIIANNEVLPKSHKVYALIRNNITKTEKPHEVYFAVNEQRDIKHNKTSKNISNTVQQKKNFYLDHYPMILKESIYFKGIPVFDISFKHILKNETYQLSIVDYGKEEPTIIYHSDFKEPIEFQSTINDLISRAFLAKKYFAKIDKLNEIVLMIYMAKADGVVEEKEKEIIEERIENIHNFTKKEQELIFNLMEQPSLPQISKKYCVFTSDQVESEVKENLIKLIAQADGEYESEEQKLFAKISDLILASRSQRHNAVTAFISTWQISLPIFILIGVIILIALLAA